MRISLYEITQEAGITDQTGKGKGEAECCLCHRAMTEDKAAGSLHVHMSTGLDLLPMTEDRKGFDRRVLYKQNTGKTRELY